MKKYLLSSLVLLMGFVSAQSATDSWFDNLDFSLYASANGEQGASESDNIIIGLEAKHDNQQGSVWGFQLEGDLKRTQNTTVDRSYEALVDYARSYRQSVWGWFASLGYEVEAFQAIEEEVSAELGVNLDLFDYLGKDKQLDEFSLRNGIIKLGVSYLSREFETGATEEGSGIVIGYDYSREYTDKYIFNSYTGYEYYLSEDELDTFTFENSVTLPFSANEKMKLKLGVKYEYFPNIQSAVDDYEVAYYSNIVWNF